MDNRSIGFEIRTPHMRYCGCFSFRQVFKLVNLFRVHTFLMWSWIFGGFWAGPALYGGPSYGGRKAFCCSRIDISLSQDVAAAFLESPLGALGFPSIFCVN